MAHRNDEKYKHLKLSNVSTDCIDNLEILLNSKPTSFRGGAMRAKDEYPALRALYEELTGGDKTPTELAAAKKKFENWVNNHFFDMKKRKKESQLAILPSGMIRGRHTVYPSPENFATMAFGNLLLQQQRRGNIEFHGNVAVGCTTIASGATLVYQGASVEDTEDLKEKVDKLEKELAESKEANNEKADKFQEDLAETNAKVAAVEDNQRKQEEVLKTVTKDNSKKQSFDQDQPDLPIRNLNQGYLSPEGDRDDETYLTAVNTGGDVVVSPLRNPSLGSSSSETMFTALTSAANTVSRTTEEEKTAIEPVVSSAIEPVVSSAIEPVVSSAIEPVVSPPVKSDDSEGKDSATDEKNRSQMEGDDNERKTTRKSRVMKFVKSLSPEKIGRRIVTRGMKKKGMKDSDMDSKNVPKELRNYNKDPPKKKKRGRGKK